MAMKASGQKAAWEKIKLHVYPNLKLWKMQQWVFSHAMQQRVTDLQNEKHALRAAPEGFFSSLEIGQHESLTRSSSSWSSWRRMVSERLILASLAAAACKERERGGGKRGGEVGGRRGGRRKCSRTSEVWGVIRR
jgi:hypothetical protein